MPDIVPASSCVFVSRACLEEWIHRIAMCSMGMELLSDLLEEKDCKQVLRRLAADLRVPVCAEMQAIVEKGVIP